MPTIHLNQHIHDTQPAIQQHHQPTYTYQRSIYTYLTKPNIPTTHIIEKLVNLTEHLLSTGKLHIRI